MLCSWQYVGNGAAQDGAVLFIEVNSLFGHSFRGLIPSVDSQVLLWQLGFYDPALNENPTTISPKDKNHYLAFSIYRKIT